MKYLQLRHASGVLTYAGKEILIDPMFAPKEVGPAIPNTWNDKKNPMIEMPISTSEFTPPQYLLVTHLHPDHFDEFAVKLLPKDIALICQKEDEKGFIDMGFENLLPIKNKLTIDDIQITKVIGQHGTGKTATAMGTSSGYILKARGESTLYITGDTIYYDGVKENLLNHQPEVIIAFAGCAQFSDDFLDAGPITLSPDHLKSIHNTSPTAKIICTHMDAINHCKTSREDLRTFVSENIEDQSAFIIPDDGETIEV